MMRLGVDGRELEQKERTGIGRYVEEVIRGVSHVGWECVVYHNQPLQVSLDLQGVKFHALKTKWTAWWDQVNLPRCLAEHGISVFLSPYYKGPLFSPCPVVLTIHDLLFIRYPGSRNPCYDFMMTRLAKLYAYRAMGIITDSEFSKRSIITQLGIDPRKICTIPIALSSSFRPSKLDDHTRIKYGLTLPYILYVGNFKPHKNIPRLLEAYSKLDQTLRNTYQLVLAGSDSKNQKALEQQVADRTLKDRVHFPGHIEDQDLPALYSGATLMVLPSLVEGFGLTALEAMGCGCPVVAAKRSAIPEVVGDAARFFDPEQVESITSVLNQVLTEISVQEKCRTRGLARAAEFSSEKTTDQVLDLLRDLSGTAPTPNKNSSPVARLKREDTSAKKDTVSRC